MICNAHHCMFHGAKLVHTGCRYTVEHRFKELLCNEVFDITSFLAPVIVKYKEKNLDTTKPRHSQQVLLAPLVFHYIEVLLRIETDRIWLAYLCHSSSSNQVGWWVSNSISFIVSMRAHVLASVARIRWHAALSVGVRFCAVFCSHDKWTTLGIYKIQS